MQRRFAIVRVRLYILMMALCTIAFEISARPLSPEEALSSLETRISRKYADNRPQMQLAHVVGQSSRPALYVFTNVDSPGFCILAADDTLGDILLGYSDSSIFNPADIHPAMQWLLDAYEARVSAMNPLDAPRARRVAIAPLIGARWAQDSPFNDLCPEIGGRRTNAGCVSVAMAQLMKMHQWPATGVGSEAYEYTVNYNDVETTVGVASDFSSHTYQWQDMLDSYGEGGSAAQREAVALLVSDCGVACLTEYAESSSSNPLKAGRGMLEHFDYDKSMKYIKREWCTYSEWEDLIYSQLEAGRPVVYSGNSESEGHTFLIDGADGEGFFHFNWGWAGAADGYYSLADLSPVSSGDGLQSFNSEQNVLVDVMPNVGSRPSGSIAIAGKLSTNKSEYNSDNDYINVIGGFYSFAFEELNYSLGFEAETNPPVYINVMDGTLATTWGYNQIAVFAGAFPDGEYDVYPVFRTSGGQWQKMYYDRTLTSGCLHFVKQGRTLSVSGGSTPESVIGNVVSATFVGTEPHEGLEKRLFPGMDYDFVFDIAVDGECAVELRTVLVDDSGEVVASGAPVVKDFSSAEVARMAFPIAIGSDVAPGRYHVECMVRDNGADRVIPDVAWVEVYRENIELDVTNLHIYIGEEYAITAVTHSDLIPVVWTSSDERVATVDSCGVVKAVAEGIATITAVCGGVWAECVVDVSPVLPESIEVMPTYILLEVGKSMKLEVTIFPSNTTDKTVTWECSNPKALSIESDGTLTALSKGYAEITATCGDVSTKCFVSAFAGIDGVESDAVSVSATGSGVHVSAPGDTWISVYGVDGSLFYEGTSHDITLPPSRIFIVVVGGEVFKVIIEP